MPFDLNDLDALKRGDEEAWCRAYPALWQIAVETVTKYMGAYFAHHVEDVAAVAINTFQKEGIAECRSPGGIIAFVRLVARNRAIDFVKKRTNHFVTNSEMEAMDVTFSKACPDCGDYAPDVPANAATKEDADSQLSDRLEYFKDHLLLYEVGADVAAEALSTVLELSALDSALLREHVLEDLGQREFAERHGISVNGVGARKERLLKKVRVSLESPPKLRRITEEIKRRRRT